MPTGSMRTVLRVTFRITTMMARIHKMWNRMVQLPKETAGMTSVSARGREVTGAMPNFAFFMSTTPTDMVARPKIYSI